MESSTDTSIPQLILLVCLVLERIFKLFLNSHCYKKFSIKSSLGNIEIETEENPETPEKQDDDIKEIKM